MFHKLIMGLCQEVFLFRQTNHGGKNYRKMTLKMYESNKLGEPPHPKIRNFQEMPPVNVSEINYGRIEGGGGVRGGPQSGTPPF